jgi:ABC-type transport system involved in multi-copper enzyme maturation permease subunit
MERELRAQSRLARVYWLRWLGALGLVLGTYLLLRGRLSLVSTRMMFGPDGVPLFESEELSWLGGWEQVFETFDKQGLDLLATMNAFVLVSIWVLAPFLTADCLSLERRQGTLGILLLTPMRAIDVVVAKGMVHGWQAAWVFLAGLPVLVIPVMLGGVSWLDGLHIALVDVSALLLALLAGMVASSLWNGPRAVAVGAAVLGVGFGFLLSVAWALAYGAASGLGLNGLPAARGPLAAAWLDFTMTWDNAFSVILAPGKAWSDLGRTPAIGLEKLVQAVAGLGVALGILVAGLVFTSRRVLASVQEKASAGKAEVGEAPMDEELERGTGVVSRWRRWMLEGVRKHNPFLWVELRTWRGHVVPGLSVAIVFPWEAWRSLVPGNWGLGASLSGPVWVLVGILAFAAASCLYEEKASGSLELLLTAPKGARRLLKGKFTGLVLQVLPAFILVVSIESSLALGVWDTYSIWGTALGSRVVVGLALLGRLMLAATAGAYFGLRFRGVIPAWAATLAVLVLTQNVGRGLALWATGQSRFTLEPSPVLVAGGIDLSLALLCGWLSYHVLNRRTPMHG